MPVEMVTGDLLEQRVDAIVNAWNRNFIPYWLLVPQGVSGAIKRIAGLAPFRELGTKPLPLGSARHTLAGKLPHRGIIHVAALDARWCASERSIRDSALSACELARLHGYRSLAMPVLGSGSGGFPEDRALELLMATLSSAPCTLALHVRVVRFKAQKRS